MDRQEAQPVTQQDTQITVTERPAYEPPRVTAMDEADVLKAFQFTSASVTWWVM